MLLSITSPPNRFKTLEICGFPPLFLLLFRVRYDIIHIVVFLLTLFYKGGRLRRPSFFFIFFRSALQAAGSLTRSSITAILSHISLSLLLPLSPPTQRRILCISLCYPFSLSFLSSSHCNWYGLALNHPSALLSGFFSGSVRRLFAAFLLFLLILLSNLFPPSPALWRAGFSHGFS